MPWYDSPIVSLISLQILCFSKEKVYAILNFFFLCNAIFNNYDFSLSRMSKVGVDEQDNGSRIEVKQIQSEWSTCPFNQRFLYLLLHTKGSLVYCVVPSCWTSWCCRTFLVIMTIRDKNALWNTDSLKVFFPSFTYNIRTIYWLLHHSVPF
jgi:hypothetical protein